MYKSEHPDGNVRHCGIVPCSREDCCYTDCTTTSYLDVCNHDTSALLTKDEYCHGRCYKEEFKYNKCFNEKNEWIRCDECKLAECVKELKESGVDADFVCTSKQTYVSLFEFCKHDDLDIVLCGAEHCDDEKDCCKEHCQGNKCPHDYCSEGLE